MKKNSNDMLLTVQWKNNSVILIDQTKLPSKLRYVICKNHHQIARAIKTLTVRGAPAIGVTAGFGLALAALNSKSKTTQELSDNLLTAYDEIRSTRPTAVNLKWALDKLMKCIDHSKTVDQVTNRIIQESKKMAQEDISINKKIGSNGSILFSNGDTVLTHCNAGSLATVAYGTALGVIRSANESGKKIHVIATETRPVMQGSRLTAFELKHEKIDVSLIPDTAVGYIMSKNKIKHVVVGADRILKTGHVFNKIGTYQLALLAKTHNIPFYVAAPLSTFDLKSNLKDIVIEERSKNEVLKIGNKFIAPDDIKVLNPAFDITPPNLISDIITEKGIISKPFNKNIKKLFKLV
ncbi:MAG: S-methyl-5-thioribose-1-phosphate isomerase [Nitrososphaeraceae archaeon]